MKAKRVCQSQNLAKYFLRRPVLQHVSFEIFQGQFILLTGDNGSGKTTLLRIVTTLLAPTQGQMIHFDGEPGLSLARIRQRIAYLSSHTLLHPDLTLMENLQLLATLSEQGASTRDIAQELDHWNLSHLAHQACRTLSKGELQKANIVRSLLHTRELIVWDEPQNGLDAKSQERLHARMLALKAQGHTLLCTSHFETQLPAIFDQHWHLKEGRLSL